MGSAEGRSPFAGSLRVSLRYKFFPPFLAGRGIGGWSKGFFSTLLGEGSTTKLTTDGLMANTVQFEGHEKDQISGYLARPTGTGPYPGVVVIHEVFGLTTWVREVARKIADRGYVALAPDLHHREGPGDEDDVAAIVRAAGGNPDARTIGDVEGAMAHLRSLDYCTGKIGAIGYCSGGRQTYLVACNIPSLDAAVDCYGGRVVAAPTELNERQPRAPHRHERGAELSSAGSVRRRGRQSVSRGGPADRAGAKTPWEDLRAPHLREKLATASSPTTAPATASPPPWTAGTGSSPGSAST